jgi:uncharacterized protein
MMRTVWLALALLALAACREPADAAPASATDTQGSKVPQTLDIARHFSGPELALARAAAAGDGNEVRRLVHEERADPNAISPGGLPLVAWPVLQGNVAGVSALLDNGADANREVPAAGHAIAWAAKAPDPQLLQAFLDHGGKVDSVNADGEPLAMVAALAGRWDNVKLLVERGADVDATAHGMPGDTLLGHYSAGQFDKAEWLLQHGADPSWRIEQAIDRTRVGAQPIIENIYWWPVQAARFPQLADAQRRCQDLVAARGHAAPAEPPHLARLRASQAGNTGGDAGPRDLDGEIRDAEGALKDKLGQH